MRLRSRLIAASLTMTAVPALLIAGPAAALQQEESTPSSTPATTPTRLQPTQIRPVQTQPVQTQPVQTQIDPSVLQADRLTAVQAQRRTPTPSDPVIYPVNWGQVAEDRNAQLAAQRETATTAAVGVQTFPTPANPNQAGLAAQSRLPILLPTSAALALPADAVFLLFPAENHYTASFTANGLVIEIFGTRRAHATPPDAAATRRLRATDPEGFQITATRYGRELTFNRYGSAYSITVECDSPESAARCANDDYVRRLARSLVIAAGQPGEGG